MTKTLHSPKTRVCCAVGNCGVIGFCFFENNNGNAVAVKPVCYITTINNFWGPKLCWRRIPIRRLLFQQDGAIAHTARASTDVLRPLLGDCLVCRFPNTPSTPSTPSPDLPMCDYLNARVYLNKPRILDDFKHVIRGAGSLIHTTMPEWVEANFIEQL